MRENRFSERLVSELPSPQREVLTLRLRDGYTAEEVAEEMRISVLLVRRIQQQGWAQIQRSLRTA